MVGGSAACLVPASLSFRLNPRQRIQRVTTRPKNEISDNVTLKLYRRSGPLTRAQYHCTCPEPPAVHGDVSGLDPLLDVSPQSEVRIHPDR